MVGDQGAGCALDRGVVPGLGHRDAHGPAIAIAVERHRPTHRRQRQVGGEVLCVRSALTEGGQSDVHEVGPGAAQRVEAETPAVHPARASALEHEVGAGHQVEEVVASVVVVEVDHDAALAPVVGVEPEAGQRRRLAVDERSLPSRRRAARWLHLDHVGAEAGQDEGGQLGPPVGQVEYPVWSEHAVIGRHDPHAAIHTEGPVPGTTRGGRGYGGRRLFPGGARPWR